MGSSSLKAPLSAFRVTPSIAIRQFGARMSKNIDQNVGLNETPLTSRKRSTLSLQDRGIAITVTFRLLLTSSVARGCVGRNLAFLELQIIIASILRRYDFILENPDEPVCSIFLKCYA